MSAVTGGAAADSATLAAGQFHICNAVGICIGFNELESEEVMLK